MSSTTPTYPPSAHLSRKASSPISPQAAAPIVTQPAVTQSMSMEQRGLVERNEKVQRLRGGCIPCPVSSYFCWLVGLLMCSYVCRMADVASLFRVVYERTTFLRFPFLCCGLWTSCIESSLLTARYCKRMFWLV
ncbi:hypothetical protein F5879DRAFT_33312 [Lentinula edodes]|nr:hypothetical protein F5879DRAFT_33312 [Lentinula edodes]